MDQEPEKLERELEELKEKVKLVEEALEDIQEDDDSEEIEDFSVFDWYQSKFVLHWVTDEEYDSSDIQNLEGVKTVFLEAAQSRDSAECSVQHGDMMIIGGSCAWFALCVVPNPKQKHDPHLPEVAKTEGDNKREFVVWNACAGTGDPCVPTGSETLVPYVSDVSWNDPSMVDGVKTHEITITNMELIFDSCGNYLRSDSASPSTITIKECCEDDDPPESPCGDGLPDTFTFTPTGGAPVTLTRDPNLGGTGMGCNHWWSDVALTWTGDYVLARSGNTWVVGGTIPSSTCTSINVTQFAKIGGANVSPIGTYECADNVGVVQGAIS